MTLYGLLFYIDTSKLSSGTAGPAIVSIMVMAAVLFSVNPVMVPAAPVPFRINDSSGSRFYHHNTRWRRWTMVVPGARPVAVIIAWRVGTVGTG